MLLPQLEEEGLLTREVDPRDKRVMRLTLTSRGVEHLMKALEVHTALIDQVMAQSTPAECDMVGDQMRRIVEMLKDE